MKNKTRMLTEGAIIAAMYVALTFVSKIFGLDSGAIQIRISEALCIMPIFSQAAVPGLFIGCLIANILTGCAVWDVVFGAIATLIGAIGTRCFAKKRLAAMICPIISNTVIVPIVIKTVYNIEMAYPVVCLCVFVGEVISCGILGQALIKVLDKSSIYKQ